MAYENERNGFGRDRQRPLVAEERRTSIFGKMTSAFGGALDIQTANATASRSPVNRDTDRDRGRTRQSHHSSCSSSHHHRRKSCHDTREVRERSSSRTRNRSRSRRGSAVSASSRARKASLSHSAAAALSVSHPQQPDDYARASRALDPDTNVSPSNSRYSTNNVPRSFAPFPSDASAVFPLARRLPRPSHTGDERREEPIAAPSADADTALRIYAPHCGDGDADGSPSGEYFSDEVVVSPHVTFLTRQASEDSTVQRVLNQRYDPHDPSISSPPEGIVLTAKQMADGFYPGNSFLRFYLIVQEHLLAARENGDSECLISNAECRTFGKYYANFMPNSTKNVLLNALREGGFRAEWQRCADDRGSFELYVSW